MRDLVSSLIGVMCIFVSKTSFSAAVQQCPASHAGEAIKFSKELESRSPIFFDRPMRNYILQDLDNNGCLEVLEWVNSLEEENNGLLNAELYPAFEWVNIFSYRNGKFVEATGQYRSFLTVRKAHYEHWLRVLSHPETLEPYSQQILTMRPKPQLEQIVRANIGRIEKLLGPKKAK